MRIIFVNVDEMFELYSKILYKYGGRTKKNCMVCTHWTIYVN